MNPDITKVKPNRKRPGVGLNALLCLAGWHEYAYRFDEGKRHPVCKTEFGILYFSDMKVVCGRCGKVHDVNGAEYEHLPEILQEYL